MRLAPEIFALLALAGAFASGGRLLVWQAERAPSGGSVMEQVLGETRRTFALHALLKADAYFHSGFYPSMFDLAQQADRATKNKTHLESATKTSATDHHEHEHAGPAPARDWLEAFGRNFFPSTHRHIERLGDEREILPWLRLAAELDPHRVETYTVAAFWLRERLNRVPDAEQFLREGLRANPRSFELLFELGALYAENNRDVPRARAILELSVQRWIEHEARKPEPDTLAHGPILALLADLEERTGNLERALFLLTRLKQVSPDPARIQKSIDEITAKLKR